MANIFTNLPAPAGNGPGTGVDVSQFGATKTITVEGNGSTFEPFVTIQIANDAAGNEWSDLVQFREVGDKTFTVACKWMRAVVQNYKGGGAPTVELGGTDDGAQVATLVAPAGNGNGAGVDVSALGNFKTVQVVGTFRGSLIIEVSEDGGTTYAEAMAFQGAPGIQSAILNADFMRVTRNGVPAIGAGLPTINVGGANVAVGDGSIAVAAGSQTAVSGTVNFANSNGITFGMSNSSQITASYTQSTSPAAIAAGAQTIASGTIVFSNGNNVTFGMNNGTITASIQTAGGTATGVGISAGTETAGTGAVVFSNSNGVTFGMNASTVTASVSRYVFSNSNNVSFGINGSTVTATATVAGNSLAVSGNVPGSTYANTLWFDNANNIGWTVSQVAGQMQVRASADGSVGAIQVNAAGPIQTGTVVFSNSNNVSFGINGSTITASATVAATAETPFAISAGTQSVSTGTFVLSNSNGVTFGLAGSRTVTASFSSVVFSNSNNVSFGLNGSTLTATATLQATIFSNSNNVSFGLNGSTVTATATVAATAETPFGISAGTQSVSTGTMIFSNSNNVSFGMSGSSRITASASIAATVFSNSNNVSFGLNGSTVTATATFSGGGAQAVSAVEFNPPQALIGSQSIEHLTVYRTSFAGQISATRCEVLYSSPAAGGANIGSITIGVAMYTMNGSTASLASSRTFTTQYGTTNHSDVSGARWRSLTGGTWNVTPGDYLVVVFGNVTSTFEQSFYGVPRMFPAQPPSPAGFGPGIITSVGGWTAAPASFNSSAIIQTALFGGATAFPGSYMMPCVRLVGTF